MKKLATLMIACSLVVMYSCGPSAKEKEAKRIADSTRVADSMAMVQAQQKRVADSIALVQAQAKKVADSIAHQDSVKKGLIKKAKPAGKPGKPAPKKAKK